MGPLRSSLTVCPSCPCNNLLYFLLNLCFIILLKLVFFGFSIGYLNHKIHSTPLTENLFQKLHDFIASGLGNNCILQIQGKMLLIGKSKICCPQQISFQNRVRCQFIQDTFLVYLIELLRSILTGKLIFLHHKNASLSSENLCLDCLFQFFNVLIENQSPSNHVDSYFIFIMVGTDFLNSCFL